MADTTAAAASSSVDDGAAVMSKNARVQEFMEVCRYGDDEDFARLDEILQDDPLVVNMRDDSGRTGLHMAAANGLLRVVCRLLSLNPQPNVQNAEGNTALHYAAEANQLEIVKALLANGWRVDVRNRLGRTALNEISSRQGFDEMEVLLLKNDETLEQYSAPGASAHVDEDASPEDDDLFVDGGAPVKAAAAAGQPQPASGASGAATAAAAPTVRSEPTTAAGMDEIE